MKKCLMVLIVSVFKSALSSKKINLSYLKKRVKFTKNFLQIFNINIFKIERGLIEIVPSAAFDFTICFDDINRVANVNKCLIWLFLNF